MIQFAFFMKESSEIVSEQFVIAVINQLNFPYINYSVVSNEKYWKDDRLFKIVVNIHYSEILDRINTEILINKLSNKWDWSGKGSSAHSSRNIMGATFIDERIEFISIWVEELE